MRWGGRSYDLDERASVGEEFRSSKWYKDIVKYVIHCLAGIIRVVKP